jgi:hypothetical protein
MKRKRPTRRSKFRSKFEETVASALNAAGVTHSYESMKLTYTKECKYTPDFVLDNGIILEVKGYWVASDRTKHLRVREAHPELDIRFVFQRASNTLSKKSKTTYGDWCDKHGFLWCEKKLPHEWTT